MKSTLHRQIGASLIEVMVAVLILSFGMLALGGMMSYAVQLPKLAGYRASATSIGAAHVERMRANIDAFKVGAYASTTGEPMTYGVENWAGRGAAACSYPNCTAANMAALDVNETNEALRRELPGGNGANAPGIRVTCVGACDSLNPPEGELWVMWSEPNTFAELNAANSDECPVATAPPTFTAFTAPAPRCLHIRFKL